MEAGGGVFATSQHRCRGHCNLLERYILRIRLLLPPLLSASQ